MKKTTLLIAFLLILFLNSYEMNSQNTKPVVFQGFTVDMPFNIQDFSWNDVTIEIEVDVKDLSSGIYMIKLESELGTSVKKIIKSDS